MSFPKSRADFRFRASATSLSTRKLVSKQYTPRLIVHPPPRESGSASAGFSTNRVISPWLDTFSTPKEEASRVATSPVSTVTLAFVSRWFSMSFL